jgi:hypothetical protein
MIWAQQLPAQKLGRDYFINEMDLKLVEGRKPGRSRKNPTEDAPQHKKK